VARVAYHSTMNQVPPEVTWGGEDDGAGAGACVGGAMAWCRRPGPRARPARPARRRPDPCRAGRGAGPDDCAAGPDERAAAGAVLAAGGWWLWPGSAWANAVPRASEASAAPPAIPKVRVRVWISSRFRSASAAWWGRGSGMPVSVLPVMQQ
jgi:hypothetical protein